MGGNIVENVAQSKVSKLEELAGPAILKAKELVVTMGKETETLENRSNWVLDRGLQEETQNPYDNKDQMTSYGLYGPGRPRPRPGGP